MARLACEPRRFTLSRCEQASENTMAQLADHVANSVLGSGNAVAMFPTPSRARRRTTARTMSRTTSPGASCCDPR